MKKVIVLQPAAGIYGVAEKGEEQIIESGPAQKLEEKGIVQILGHSTTLPSYMDAEKRFSYSKVS